MTSNADLEKSIRRYSDTFGTVLLGMHQDLQNRQHEVDRKLNAWHEKAEAFAAEINAAHTDIQTSAKKLMEQISVETTQLRAERNDTMSKITLILSEITAASSRLEEATGTAISNIDRQLHDVETASTKQLQTVRDALTTATSGLAKLTQVHRVELQNQVQGISAVLSQVKNETDNRLKALEQSQLAHHRQMIAFAQRTRMFLLGTIAVATMLVTAGVLFK